jgi:glutamyl-tRNA synthetase
LKNGYPTVGILEYFLNIMNSNFADWRLQNPKLPYTDFELKLEKFNKAGALFDMVKLEDTCKEYVSRLSAEEVYLSVLKWAKKYNENLAARLSENREYSIRIFNIEREGKKIRKDIVKWSDVLAQFEIFFDDMFISSEKGTVEFENDLQKGVLHDFLETLDFGNSREEWFEKIKEIAVKRGFCTDYKEYESNPEKYHGKVGDVAMIIRVAMTGKKQTPDLYEVIQVMGEERVSRRIDEYMKSL